MARSQKYYNEIIQLQMFANKKLIIIVLNNPNFCESRLKSDIQQILLHRKYTVVID